MAVLVAYKEAHVGDDGDESAPVPKPSGTQVQILQPRAGAGRPVFCSGALWDLGVL